MNSNKRNFCTYSILKLEGSDGCGIILSSESITRRTKNDKK